ncbi:GTP 3',8-cyclase MoaA [Rhizohabitans arisaemae]|uniref:GTP 3',8-cyclase MoaA n=1 Tax=Rhizohabitans arisaemae TaxID=2720610 RepID=UPI0024B10ECB|nr:GTP 3',8-cyclase MoaA [Rhizohabitans arisaemae]
MTGGGLVDRYGRVATDLRVSVTDRCNLRCVYCMPAEGLAWLPRNEVLTDAELVRVIRVGVELLGIREVRFTGGEPLIRPGLASVIAEVAALTPRPDIAVTTNGLTLARHAGALTAAGLNRVNVSLDTLRRDRFRELTRRDRLDDVLVGLRAAVAHGLTPVKVNAVLMRGVNDDEACDLLSFCLDQGYELRFIEQMPLDADRRWSRADMVTADEIFASLRTRFTLTPLPGRGASPAEHFLVGGGPARVGVIASVTRPFCGDCDRTRLTADGQIRSCLFSRTEDDLRTLLRSGAPDSELAQAWRGAMTAKPAGHGVDDPTFIQPPRPMSAIGG